MRKIWLYTSDLQFVRDAEVPPFDLPPDVIVWGARIFVRAASATPQGETAARYVEAFTFFVP